jgi:outer membrane protein assembly factor BamB
VRARGFYFHALKALRSLSFLLPIFLCFLHSTATAEPYRNTNYWSVSVGFYSDASPALDTNGVLYVATWEGMLRAINPDHSFKWSLRFSTDIKSSPAISDDGTIYIGCRDRKLHAVSPDGKRKWTFKTDGWVDSSAAIATNGTIYFGSWDKRFYALNPDGTKRWEFITSGEIESSPAIGRDGTIYFGSHDKKFYALNPDGSKGWEFATGGQIISSPAIGSDGTIFITSLDGKMYALNPDGSVRWATHTGGITESSPVLGTNGLVFVGVNSNFCAFSGEGKKLWSFAIGQYFPTDAVRGSGAVGTDGCTYFGTDDQRLWKAGPDGLWQWLVWLGSPCKSSTLIGPNRTVYAVSYGFHAYGVTNEATLANTSWPMFRADPQHTGRARNVTD